MINRMNTAMARTDVTVGHWRNARSRRLLMKRSPVLGVLLVLFASPAYPQKKESERVANAGRVITEILGIPDNIPQDLIDKAECAIVLPKVLKFAFGLGGSYGRGVMTCRGGQNFNGAWG